MKQLLSNYSISGNIVTLTGVNRPKEAILQITNSTTGNILYTAQTGGATAYSQGTNSTITLSTASGATDRLQIHYDDGVTAANAPSIVSLAGGTVSLSNPTTGTPTLGAAVSLASGQSVSLTGGTVSLSGGAVTNSNLDVALSTRLKAADTLASVTSVGSITNAVTIQGGNATAVKVDGSAVTQPVSLASVPSHAVTNAGTFAVQPTNGSNSLAIDSLGAATVNTPSVQTFSTSSTLASGNAINWGSGTSINCAQFRSVAVHFATGSGVVTGQVSNDNTNWLPTQLWNLGGSIVTNGQLGAGNAGVFPTEGFLYFRLLVSTSLTGSVSIIATPSQTAPVFPAVAVSGTVAVSNGNISFSPSSTPTSAAPATFTSITSAQILASNSSRKGIVLSSPSTNTGVCYVVIGTSTASTSSFSFPVNPGDILSLTGIGNALTGIWSASSNTLYVTELT